MKWPVKFWMLSPFLSCRCLIPPSTHFTRKWSSRSQKNAPGLEVGRTVYQRLIGRDLLSFDGYTRNDVYSLLWIATELKQLQDQSPPSCRNKRIGLIWSNPIVKASISHSSQLLNASLYCVHENQLGSSSTNNYEMLGRSLAHASDIIFLDTPSWAQPVIAEFAAGSHCPVITLSSKDYSPGLALAELMTLYEKYGFLRRLIIAYIGNGSSPMLNTYFSLLPIVGAHLRLLVDGPVDNVSAWENGYKLASKYSTEVKQLENLEDTLYRIHTISTSFQESPTIRLRLKDTKEMHLDWTYLQSDSFRGLAASKDFLKEREHTLISDVISNQSWIFQALVAGYATDYNPISKPPRFEGVD